MARFYRMDPERIRVVPPGIDTRVYRRLEDRAGPACWRQATLGDDAPVLLYVGKPARRRNLPALLEAFARLRREGLPHRLVLIGTGLAGAPVRPVVERLGITAAVTEIAFAGPSELALAYNAADALIYPTSYEGFGLPVLEALACGTPVVALDATAIPEFAGGVAILLPDAEPGTLCAGILQAVTDRDLRAAVARDGPRRAARYDWRVIAPRFVDLLVEAARG